MTFIGLYIILFLLISELYNFNKINLGILIGIIIPDLDLILKYLNIHSLYHGSIMHSIIFILIFYISLLIINELNKKVINNIIINGIFLGMLLHVILDILLSSGFILFYWPLPIPPIKPIYDLYLDNNMLYFLGCIQLLSLRYFGHKMIIKILNKDNPSENFHFNINLISHWMKFQTTILLSFIFMYFFEIEFPLILMDISIFCSILIAAYFLYKIRELTNEDLIIG
tara:strand:+ start:1923 stop:2603 length:681 start_codon:yes stop_codon:yes gene_type:complete